MKTINKEKRKKYCKGTHLALWLICMVLVICLPALSMLLVRYLTGYANSVDVQNYYTSFIALCTTFVVGFQIFNTIEWNKKFKTLEQEKENFTKQINKLEKESKAYEQALYYNAYTIGNGHYENSKTKYEAESEILTPRYCWNALRAYTNALRYASGGAHNITESFGKFGRCIYDCMSEIENVYKYYTKEGYDKIELKELDNKDLPDFKTRKIILRKVYDYLTETFDNLKTNSQDEELEVIVEELISRWKRIMAFYNEDEIL